MSWTEEVLAELRAARYAPLAWVRLLRRSFIRAAEVRRQRRREHRQTLLLALAGLAAWAAVALAGRPWLALAGAAWWALVALIVDWHLGMLDEQRRLGVANVLTIARAGTVPALLVLPPLALATVLVPAGVLDGLDGPVARARGETTRLGRWLDGSVDGLVLGAAAIGAARAGLLPDWAVALVLARHGLQWLVVAAAYLVRARPPALDALVSGKLPGLVLFAGLALAALHVSGAAALVAAGALGGLGAFALTLVRSRRVAAVS
ncbi:MAG TPA: CDP-alcohol phosphatidyltransferase family protein [Gaiellaceae bacterium]|nr:CDP-alcohol phosphatidyltransferase family protein [Gaiellaceae bacterium]